MNKLADTRLTAMFTPNSKAKISLADAGRYPSGYDNMQLRIFTNDEGEALHMGIVAGPEKVKKTFFIGFHKEEPVQPKNVHPVLIKAQGWLHEQVRKLSEWTEKQFPKQRTEPTYHSSYRVS